MVKLMRGKHATGSRAGPHRVGSPGWSGHFGLALYMLCRDKYGRVFGIAQLDVH
jgi:hypothetical protein